MVSSRCVLGSSKGMRLFSTSSTMNRLSTTKTSAPPLAFHAESTPSPSMVDNDVEPERLASTTNPSNSPGSASAEKVASRAAPMPSKAEPVSSAARMVKNRPRPNR